MMYVFVALMLALASMTVFGSPQEPQQVLPLENINVDGVLKNDKLVMRYIDCVLDRGRCEKNGNDLKGKIIFDLTLGLYC